MNYKTIIETVKDDLKDLGENTNWGYSKTNNYLGEKPRIVIYPL